ncbi:MAG: hypothetical protein JSW00_15460 [Thermoplasmata archaeon]|nr:MAG: hypothetical protein JSW00_15460 [Thermoplasmata archaeon]
MLVIILFLGVVTIPGNVCANSKPEVINPVIVPSSPLTDDDLVAIYDVYDPDGDEIEDIEIRWFKSGLEQGQYNDLETLPASATVKGDLWHYSIRAFDGFNYSDENTSSYVEISNSPPVILELSPNVSDITIDETEGLNFYAQVEDPDGDFLLYKWNLSGEIEADDVTYIFATDYESAGAYLLTLTVQDIGENSYTLSYEWTIIVNNVNLPPQIEVKEPISKTPKMKEVTSLKFMIEEEDPDAEDTLEITWFFDENVVQTSGSSYTYFADNSAAGEHIVKVVVSDGTDSVEYSWNLTVEDTESASPPDHDIPPFVPSLNDSDFFLFLIAMILIILFVVILLIIVIFEMGKKPTK